LLDRRDREIEHLRAELEDHVAESNQDSAEEDDGWDDAAAKRELQQLQLELKNARAVASSIESEWSSKHSAAVAQLQQESERTEAALGGVETVAQARQDALEERDQRIKSLQQELEADRAALRVAMSGAAEARSELLDQMRADQAESDTTAAATADLEVSGQTAQSLRDELANALSAEISASQLVNELRAQHAVLQSDLAAAREAAHAAQQAQAQEREKMQQQLQQKELVTAVAVLLLCTPSACT
jgi:chromosome segregation ATPase